MGHCSFRYTYNLSLYLQPIIQAHGLFFHQYADDLQVYANFDLNHSALVAAIRQMEIV